MRAICGFSTAVSELLPIFNLRLCNAGQKIWNSIAQKWTRRVAADVLALDSLESVRP
jgi:hypothetical protein